MLQVIAVLGALAILEAYAANLSRWVTPSNIWYSVGSFLGSAVLTYRFIAEDLFTPVNLSLLDDKLTSLRTAVLCLSWRCSQITQDLMSESGELFACASMPPPITLPLGSVVSVPHPIREHLQLIVMSVMGDAFPTPIGFSHDGDRWRVW